MNVPNIEKKAFLDMTAEERSAIVEANLQKSIEYFRFEDEKWIPAESGYIRLATAYRTRQRKLEIPWEHIKSEIKYVFFGENGRVWGVDKGCYGTVPQTSKNCWSTDGGFKWFSLEGLNINTSGIDWRESLTQRPEN